MSMFYYKAKLQYNGSSYLGWQVQPKGKTIQGELNKALKEIAKSDEVKTLGSGRTDSGVHALAQVVRIEMPLSINPIGLKKGLNSILPSDIYVEKVSADAQDFHPIRDAESKTYMYIFSQGRLENPFHQDFVGRCGFKLDESLVREALEILKGEHDFCNYFTTGTPVNSTIRTIYDATLDCDFHPNFPASGEKYWILTFKGSGFLKQMVRLIVGTLWQVGQKKIDIDTFSESLKAPLEKKLGPVAPAQGLYLKEVHYPDLF